jgi:hypothetical protein
MGVGVWVWVWVWVWCDGAIRKSGLLSTRPYKLLAHLNAQFDPRALSLSLALSLANDAELAYRSSTRDYRFTASTSEKVARSLSPS